jgi:hypothetical protein
VGGLRAMLGHGEGCGLRLPQAEAPSSVARRVIHFGPESHCRDSGPSAASVGRGWVAEMGGRIAGCAHPLEKSVTSLGIQAYIAYHLGR